MSDDLVRRLRGYPGKRGMEKPPHVTMDEAADYIEKLEASESEWQPICDSYAAENQRFSDRIEKLEAALRRIKEMHHDGGVDDLQERDDRTYCVVYEALEGKIYNSLDAE